MVVDHVLAFRAGRLRTLDRDRAEVECVAVREGVVEAIGSYEEVAARYGRSAEWVDLRPAVVLPGLTDSHIHLVEWALGLRRPDLSGCDSMSEALGVVARTAGAAPPDAWLEFKGWDPLWGGDVQLVDLDAASRDRAVVLVAHDLHSGWLNSQAMRRLAIGPDRRDPPGGVVERDGSGRPTGVLKERALDWWYTGRPRAGASERIAAVLEGQAELHRLGVTAVHSVEAPDSFEILERLSQSGELRLRVLHHLPQRHIDALIECGIRSGFGSAWLRVGGVKYFTDGALGSRTAWMLEPYSGSQETGVRRLDPVEFAADVQRAAGAGLAATVHAIGDAAVRMTLDVLEAAPAGDLVLPHRIEHLQCVHPNDLPRAARAGIVASMQPSHLLTDVRLAEEQWGEDRGKRTYAFRSLLDAGTTLAFGSDAPVERPDPREGFVAAQLRTDRTGYPSDGWYPEERLNGLEVLKAYTVGAALAAGQAGRRGRLAPGYTADFAAWDVDLVSAEPERVRSAQVVATVVDGEVVHRG